MQVRVLDGRLPEDLGVYNVVAGALTRRRREGQGSSDGDTETRAMPWLEGSHDPREPAEPGKA